ELLHSLLREPGEVRGQRVAVRPLVLLEPPAVPDLEELAPQADERDIFPEPRLLPAVGRKQNASRAVELDGAGRILLPSDSREQAGLGKDVTLVGLGREFFEIWDRRRLEEYERSHGDALASDFTWLSQEGVK